MSILLSITKKAAKVSIRPARLLHPHPSNHSLVFEVAMEVLGPRHSTVASSGSGMEVAAEHYCFLARPPDCRPFYAVEVHTMVQCSP